jgi:hypothetical protein
VWLREVLPGQPLARNTSSPAFRTDVLYIGIDLFVRGSNESDVETAVLDLAQDVQRACETYHVSKGHSGLHLERFTPRVGSTAEAGIIRQARLELRVFVRTQRGQHGS